MQLWNQSGRFPINFLEIESLKDYDESEHYMQSLEKLTPFVSEIFKDIT
jgi:hypothetical protein